MKIYFQHSCEKLTCGHVLQQCSFTKKFHYMKSRARETLSVTS